MRVLLPAALLAATLASPAAAAPAAVPATVVVTGRAGEVTTIRLGSVTRLGNGGADTPVVAPGAAWAGVVLTRLDAPPAQEGMDTYVHYAMRNALLCPGRRCEPPLAFQPTSGMVDDGRGNIVLQPGRYGVALLGPAGRKVTATLRLHGARAGRVSLRTTRKAAAYVARTFDPLASGVSRGFARTVAPGRHLVDSLAIGFVLDASAVVHYAKCATSGGRRDLDSNVGGIAPCADASGVDILIRSNPMPVLVDVGGQAVGIAFMASAGRSPQGGSGMGFEAQVAGPASRVSALYVGVAF